MKYYPHSRHRQQGFTLIELMVSMVITLAVVATASALYISVQQADATQAKASESQETGAFALQLLGRDIAQAGSYPVVMPFANTTYFKQLPPNITSYPTQDLNIPASVAFVMPAPINIYAHAIYGCDGGKLDLGTGECTATTAISPDYDPPDSIILNYFTGDAKVWADSNMGNRRDCTGSDAGNDVANTVPAGNTGTVQSTINKDNSVPTSVDDNRAPYLPLLVSNRYALNSTTNTEIDKQAVSTMSLACNGNGFGSKSYQPILLGVEDLQITYGVFDISGSALELAPVKFYTATEVNKLTEQPKPDDPQKKIQSWDRVSAVRICLMTRTLGGAAKISDKSSTYLNCKDDKPKTYADGDTSIRKRHIQVFAVRNQLNQSY